MNTADLFHSSLHSPHGGLTDSQVLTPNERRMIALQGTPLQRAEFIKTITIPYPQFVDGLNLLEDAFNRSYTVDPGGVRIIGASGLGKSFICQHFLHNHPTTISNDQVSIPVLYLQLEASLSALDLVRRMLFALGFPFRTNKNRVDLTDLLAEGMEHRRVAFVLIDEAQEFAEGRGESRASVIGNTLKRIYDKTGRPHGYMGTELLERFFAINGQLAGRIAACHKLAPLAYDDIYFGVLKAFDEALPMPEVSDLCAVFAEPIYQSTNGNLRALRRLLSASVICASHDEASQLTWRHFAVAYQQVFGTGHNPFENK